MKYKSILSILKLTINGILTKINIVIFLVFYAFLFQSNSAILAQQLNVDETLLYLNKKFRDFPHTHFETTTVYQIDVSPKGELVITEYDTEKPTLSFEETKKYKTVYRIDIRKIDFNNSFKSFTISGTNAISIYPIYKEYFTEEFTGNDGTNYTKRTLINEGGINSRSIDIWFTDISLADNYINALKHLYSMVISNPIKYGFTSKSDDPFDSPIETAKSDVDVESTSNIIKLTKNAGGVYEIPIVLNDVLKINFIFDSGASEVSLSPDVALTLIKTGTILESDWLQSQTFRFADGSVAKSDRFMIRKFKIGNQVLTNVEASIANSIEAPILLGQNVMKRLGNYMIDTDNQTLIINIK